MKITVILLSFLAAEAFAYKINWHKRKCEPRCPLYSAEQLPKIDLSESVPHDPDYYKFRVRGTYNGDKYYEGKVPVYVKNGSSYRLAGEVDVGKEVKIGHLTNVSRRMFYRIQISDGSNPKFGFIDGRFLEMFALSEKGSKY